MQGRREAVGNILDLFLLLLQLVDEGIHLVGRVLQRGRVYADGDGSLGHAVARRFYRADGGRADAVRDILLPFFQQPQFLLQPGDFRVVVGHIEQLLLRRDFILQLIKDAAMLLCPFYLLLRCRCRRLAVFLGLLVGCRDICVEGIDCPLALCRPVFPPFGLRLVVNLLLFGQRRPCIFHAAHARHNRVRVPLDVGRHAVTLCVLGLQRLRRRLAAAIDDGPKLLPRGQGFRADDAVGKFKGFGKATGQPPARLAAPAYVFRKVAEGIFHALPLTSRRFCLRRRRTPEALVYFFKDKQLRFVGLAFLDHRLDAVGHLLREHHAGAPQHRQPYLRGFQRLA